MYKKHITKWSFKKYRKRGYPGYIHQTRTSRAVAGKGTELAIRSPPSDDGDLLQYNEPPPAHGTTDKEFGLERDPETPGDVEYGKSYISPKSSSSRGPRYTNTPLENEQDGDQDVSLISSAVVSRRNVDYYHYEEDRILPFNKRAQKHLTPGHNFHYHCRKIQAKHQVARILVNPQVLRLPEELFFLIDTYISISVAINTRNVSQIIPCNDLTTSLYDTHTDIKFYRACQKITSLLEQGHNDQATAPLMAAFSLVPELLRNQKPGMIYQLLEILLYIIPRGKSEHVLAIRNHLRIIATRALSKHHPLRDIHDLVSQVDADILEAVLQRALRCNRDALERNLDPQSTAFFLGRSIIASPAQSSTSSPMKTASVVAESLSDFLHRGAK